MITKDELAEWIRENESLMYRFAVSIVGNATDAEDVVCEAVVRAFEHMHALRDKTKLKTWMMSIISNVAKSMLRKKKREVLSPDMTDYCIEQEYRDMDLWNAVMKLPKPQREVIVLFYYSGYKIREIAHVLAVRIGTVQSRMQRAREKLREEYLGKERGKDNDGIGI